MYHFYSLNQGLYGFVFRVDSQQAETQSTMNANHHSSELVHSSRWIDYFSCWTVFMKKEICSKLDF